MHLRSKIVVILSVVIGLYAISNFFIQRMVVGGLFRELEQDFAQKTTVRVKNSLEEQLQLLGARCDDWVKNEEAIAYLSGTRPQFEAERLGPGLLDMQGVDLMYFCGNDGVPLWGVVRDPETGAQPAEFELEAFPAVGAGKLSDLLLTGWREEDRYRGILRPIDGFLSTEQGPLLVSSKPVFGGPNHRATVGKVILGRFLSKSFARELQGRTEAISFKAWFHDPAKTSQEVNEFIARKSGEPLIRSVDDQWLEVLHVVDAQVDQIPLIFSAKVEREISQSGAIASLYALISMIAGSLFMLGVLLNILQKIVISPVSKLTNNAVKIGQDDTADVRFDLERKDEIGVLSREFDNMMEQLAISRAALVDTARQAGQSEIATGILHNVGNVLNSVNVSSGVIAKKTEELAIGDLEALNQIISENASDLVKFVSEDPRGQHFPPFLDALTSQIAQTRQTLTDEIGSLSQGIERIRSMVNSQQDYVRKTMVIEHVSLESQVKKALELSEKVEPFDRGLEVHTDLDELPKVPVDRHRLLEILVNLIQNARQAMEDRPGQTRRLSLSLKASGEDKVRIEVSDTGCGIAADALTRVFDHGYTTKPTGNGFGLHSAANAAVEMGGSLQAFSDGPDKGSTFSLELPTQAQVTATSTGQS